MVFRASFGAGEHPAVPCWPQLGAPLLESRTPQVVQHLGDVENGGGTQAAGGLLRRWGEGMVYHQEWSAVGPIQPLMPQNPLALLG